MWLHASSISLNSTFPQSKPLVFLQYWHLCLSSKGHNQLCQRFLVHYFCSFSALKVLCLTYYELVLVFVIFFRFYKWKGLTFFKVKPPSLSLTLLTVLITSAGIPLGILICFLISGNQFWYMCYLKEVDLSSPPFQLQIDKGRNL